MLGRGGSKEAETMRRRTFLATGSAVAATALAPGFLARLLAAEGEFRDLADGVGVFIERGGTIAWRVTPDAVIVVDAQFPDTAPHCIARLKSRAPRGVDLLFNTHHHADHTAGNVAFRDVTKSIVAQENCPALQRRSAEERKTSDEQVYADTTFATEWTKDLGAERVGARYFGPAHTGGDSIVHFESAGVVHMGDLVFNRRMPYIDLDHGASIRGWAEVLAKAENTYPADATFVFGHGSETHGVVGKRADLGVMAAYLRGLLDYVAAGRKAGKTLDQLAAVETVPGFPDHTAGWDGALRHNVEAAWRELG